VSERILSSVYINPNHFVSLYCFPPLPALWTRIPRSVSPLQAVGHHVPFNASYVPRLDLAYISGAFPSPFVEMVLRIGSYR